MKGFLFFSILFILSLFYYLICSSPDISPRYIKNSSNEDEDEFFEKDYQEPSYAKKVWMGTYGFPPYSVDPRYNFLGEKK